ncbi:unnamed protein product [Absidia cylindrospora]
MEILVVPLFTTLLVSLVPHVLDMVFLSSFVDMCTIGERSRYSMAILTAIIEKYNYVDGPQFTMMYDIGCKLAKRMKAKYGATVDARLALALFHSYGHDLECLPCFGLTDGEWMERAWSYLGGFSPPPTH